MRGNLTRRCCCRARKLNIVMYPESRQEALTALGLCRKACSNFLRSFSKLAWPARPISQIPPRPPRSLHRLVKEISRRLHRDPSIISRLYAAYAATRHHEKETRLAHIVLARLARGYLWLP